MSENLSFTQASIAAFHAKLTEMQKTCILIGNTTIQQIPACHRIVMNVVTAGTDESFKAAGGGGGGEDGEEKKDARPVYAMSGTLVERIGAAAGIQWDETASRRTDDGSDPDVYEYTAVGSYRDLSGSTQRIMATYTFSYGAWYDELYNKKLDSWDKGYVKKWQTFEGETREQYATRTATKDMIQIRKNASRRAETGARNRAICKALGIKRGGFTQEALSTKPILVLRCVPDIDWERDPVAHQALILMASGAAQTAYGRQAAVALFSRPAAPALPAVAKPTGGNALMSDSNGTDLPALTADVEERQDAPAAPTGQPALPPPEEPGPEIEDHPATKEEFAERGTPAQFAELDWTDRLAVLTVLLRTRQRKPADGLTEDNLPGLGEDAAAKWFVALQKRPKKEA